VARWTGRAWVEYRRSPPGVRVVCGYCRERGEWKVQDDPGVRGEREAHEMICGAWWGFCDTWNEIAWAIGREAPYYWSAINPPGYCRCGHEWHEHRGGMCVGDRGDGCDCRGFASRGA